MSRKSTTPRKADLLAALKSITAAITDNGGIHVRIEGEGPRRRDLVSAYRKACKVLGESPAPVTRESEADYEYEADHLLGRHDYLLQLAKDRGYSTKALCGLVLNASASDTVRSLPFR